MVPLQTIDEATIAALRAEAEASPRKRSHRLLHRDHADPVQRLLIMLCVGTYVRPHVHSEQWEMATLVRGAADVLTFSPDGVLLDRIHLREPGARLVQIAPGQVHGVVAMEQGTLLLEVKPGPYRANEFVDWAPPEGTPDVPRYLEALSQAQPGARLTIS